MSKFDLLDTTFIIPYYKDSKERVENLNCIIKFIWYNFDTNVIVLESGPIQTMASHWSNKNHVYEFIKNDSGIFHRTRVINEGIKKAKTPYVAIYDTDVVFEPENILSAVELLRQGVTLSYPYDGRFIDVNRSYIEDGIIIEKESFALGSVGGACFLNREDYWKCGLENEVYQSHCPDDVDRYHRVRTLGYRVERMVGKCYHISHPASANSGVNQFTMANNIEWNKVKAMGKEELESYIKTWEWAKR